MRQRGEAGAGALVRGDADARACAGVTHVEGLARFVAPREVEVAGARYSADHVLIAVGGRPATPPIPGAEYCISSDGFFDLKAQPEKALVVGAGYIAVELAGILQALGSSVSLAVRGAGVLRHGFDPLVQENHQRREEGPLTGNRESCFFDPLRRSSTPRSRARAPSSSPTRRRGTRREGRR